MTAITADQFALALDYLPVAVRAADHNKGNDILWSEAVRAQRTVITYADMLLPEAAAAEVQNQTGHIAHFAIVEATTQYGTGHAATYSERAKNRIRQLLADQAAAAAAHVELFENEPIDLTSTIDGMIGGWLV